MTASDSLVRFVVSAVSDHQGILPDLHALNKEMQDNQIYHL